MQSKKVTEIILDSGIKVWVSPMSRYARNGLAEAAEKLYPYPDKSQFEEELPEDVAIPGMKIPAEEHPDYQAQVASANRQRGDHISGAMLNLCVVYPDFASRQEIIDHFAPYLDEQRDWLALPEDPWEATLRFAVISSVADENQIMAIVGDTLPVTEKEVNDNVRIFQPALSREKSRILDYARKHAPGAETKIPGNE